MTEAVHPVPPGFGGRIGPDELAALHRKAADDPRGFWLEQARRLDWARFPEEAGDWSFDEDDFRINWYADGTLNLSVNCLDRHLAKHGDRTAIVFEADEPGLVNGVLDASGRTVPLVENLEEARELVRTEKSALGTNSAPSTGMRKKLPMKVASAIRKTLAEPLVGKMKKASGSQAVAGSGPMSLSTGCTQ